jgi:hypothetical protein
MTQEPQTPDLTITPPMVAEPMATDVITNARTIPITVINVCPIGQLFKSCPKGVNDKLQNWNLNDVS